MPSHSSNLFDYDHETNTFTAWVSDLGSNPFVEVVNDHLSHQGCSIISSKTSQIADFFIHHVEKDQENDTLAWHLNPTTGTVQQFPLLKDTKVVIFNT